MQRAGKARALVAAGLTVLAVAVAHGSAIRNGFVTLDDGDYVYENAHVREGLTLEGLRWAFQTRQQHTYFHPVTWLSLMADAQLFGLDPRAFHAVGVALHAVAALLLLWILLATTGRLWTSWLAATLWAVHPLTVEAVSWVAERKAVLSTALGLAAILAYVHHRRVPSRWRMGAVLALGTLALLSKPSLAVLPVLLLLLDLWPLGAARDRAAWRGLVLEKLPLAAVSGLVLAIAVDSARHFAAANALAVPLGQRFLNAAVSFPSYLGAAIWPANLAVFRPFPAQTPPLAAVLGLAAAVACSAITIAVRRGRPAIFVGWAWFVVALAPFLGIQQAGLWPRWADRFAYLPLIGLAILVAFTVAGLADAFRVSPAVRALGALAVLAPLAIATRRQVAVWRSSRTLYEHAVEVVPDAAAMHYNLACVDIADGRLDAARRSLETALRIQPAVPDARAQLGAVLLATGSLGDAERELNEALRLEPTNVGALYNHATVLRALGRSAEARPLFARFLELAPPAEYEEQRRIARAALLP